MRPALLLGQTPFIAFKNHPQHKIAGEKLQYETIRRTNSLY